MFALSILRRVSAVKQPKTSAEINRILKENPLAVGWFSASWCGPCKSVQKNIEKMAEDFKDQGVSVVKIDVDDHHDVAAEFNVTSVPTFFFLKNGQMVDTVVGASAESVQAAIEKNLPQ
jgi:thioredoxin